MTDQGFTAPDIIAFLRNNGFDRNGKPFLKNAVYGMLHNTKYIGRCTLAGTVYDNIYPPIVDKDLFERVQRRLAQNQLGRNCMHTDFLLRGKVYCGYCGHRINGESGTSHNGNKYFFYKCSWRKKGKGNCTKQTVRKDDLENIVLDMAMDLFTNKVDLDIIVDEIMHVREESAKEHCELNILVAEQREAQKALDNVMKAVEAGVFTATTKNRMEELELEIDRLAVLIVKEENKLQQAISRDDVMEYLTNGVREQSPKVLMELLVHKVTLWDDHIEVEFNYSDKINPDGPVMICTPKVRHFWRCIFLWKKQGEKTGDIRQNSRYAL